MLSTAPDPQHPPLFEATGCICVHNNRVLLLKRASDRSFPNLWGLPGGKVEHSETRDRAVLRELYEETGLLRSTANIQHRKDFYVTTEEFTYIYVVFSTEFSNEPPITLQPGEHTEYRWLSLDETASLSLMPYLTECLKQLRNQIVPPLQLPLFGVEHLLRDVTHADEGRLKREIISSFREASRSPIPSPVVVIGPPAAGKSTLVREVMKHRPDISYHHSNTMGDKSTRQYMYVTRFLAGDLSFSFICQIEALAARYWHAMLTETPDTIFDEWIYSTLAYSKTQLYRNRLEDYEYQTFYMAYLAFQQWLPVPRLVIHLTAQPEVLRKRILGRGRKIEKASHQLEYLAVLERTFEEVAAEVGTKARVVRIDTSALTRSDVTNRVLELLNE
jgi:8-oxo-dGTP diphosphatase